MAIDTQQPYRKRFLIKRSDLTTLKLFVEFYLPEYQDMLNALRQGPYPLKSLGELSTRMFDGPFGSNRKVDMYQESGIPYVRVKDVLPDGIDLSGLTYVSQEKHQTIYRSRVVPGDILVTIAGRLGTAAVFPEILEEGNITGHIAGIEIPEDVSPYYLAAVINSRFGEFQVKRWGLRTTRPELNLRELGQILIPLPPRPIQDRIAQVMQDAYATRREKLAQAEALLDGIDEYVLGQLGIALRELRSRRTTVKSIGSIAGGRFDFEAVVTVQDISFDNIEPTLLRKVVRRVDDRVTPVVLFPDVDVNYISLGNIAANTGELAGFAPVKGSSILSSSPTFERGDILFGRMRPYLNKVWVAEFDGVCTGEALVFRPNREEVDTRFLHALLLSRITLHQVVPLQTGTSLPRVSATDVLNVKLPIPRDLNRQTDIGEEVERQRTEARRLCAEAETIIAEAKARVERMILGQEEVQ
jgi:restriction endonuclease S subunit